MSVLVKRMKIPNACAECPLNHDKMSCSVTGTQWWSDRIVLLDFDEYNERLPDCPLVELPETHGRLIDADKLIDYCNDMIRIISESDDDMINIITSRICYAGVIGQIINMATIFESEGE